VVGLARCLGLELAAKGITVNAVGPRLVEGEMVAGMTGVGVPLVAGMVLM